jgi:SAM-dependent methyltransferase
VIKRRISKEVFADKWLGIHFSKVFESIGACNKSNTFGVIDPKIFFDEVYRLFFKANQHFHQIDKKWRDDKDIHVNGILEQYKKINPSSTLSFGCGTGYMESLLLEQHGIQVECYDISEKCFDILHKDYPSLTTKTKMDDLSCYDFIYSNQVFYALNRNQAIETLKLLSKKLKQGGKLLIIEPSPVSSENSIKVSLMKRLRFELGLYLNPIRYFFFQKKMLNLPGSISCGWRRNSGEFQSIFKAARFKICCEYGYIDSRYYLIENEEK